MSIESSITAEEEFFIGEDKFLSYTVTEDDEVTPQDVTGWALSWYLKKRATDADADAKLTKTTVSGITISGVYNADPALNTQRVVVAIADTDTGAAGSPAEALPAGSYRMELKRTDAGSETVLSFGQCVLRQALHRE